ncbi:MAG: TRAP transporter small permease [Thermohalobaculum sp.]|nr:TRAP transporter small permease [Thermohalobaculum sp.]
MSGHSPTPTLARDGGNPVLRAIGAISTACGILAALMIVASVIITCQMIWVRFVMGQSTIWQTEAVIYLMVGATMIGLPYVQRLRGHVNVDLVPMMLARRARMALAMVTLGAGIVVTAVMFWYGFDLWHVAWERNWRSDTVWAPKLWVPYLVLPVGFGLYLLQLCADFYALLAGIERPFGLAEDK